MCVCVCGVCVYYNSIRNDRIYDIGMKVMHHNFYSIMIDFKFVKSVKKPLFVENLQTPRTQIYIP